MFNATAVVYVLYNVGFHQTFLSHRNATFIHVYIFVKK